MANQPGWYPDPWRPGRQRWWDGDGWTDHTYDPDAPVFAPADPHRRAAPTAAWVMAPDPRRDLYDEERSAVWARRSFVGWAVTRVISGIGSIFAFRDLLDSIHEAIDTNGTVHQTASAYQAVTTPAELLAIACTVGVIVWAFRAASVAAKLHYPAKHSPGWAIAGWLVPVVNFWFPYQTMRDCLAPGSPERGNVGRWWALYLFNIIGIFIPMAVGTFVSVGIGLALGLVWLVTAGLEAQAALRMVDDIAADHRRAIESITAR